MILTAALITRTSSIHTADDFGLSTAPTTNYPCKHPSATLVLLHKIQGMRRVLFGYFFLIGHLVYVIGMWFGEDQRTNTIKKTHDILEEFGLRLQSAHSNACTAWPRIPIVYIEAQDYLSS